MAGEEKLFRFVQVEFPWPLGPEPGRYVIRAPGTEHITHVIVLATLSAPERRRLRGRRPRTVEQEPPPAPVATTRATVIPTAEFEDEPAARAWLVTTRRAEHAERELDEALLVLTRAVHAHRLISADPGLPDPDHRHALVVRLGYGRGEQVADGRHSEALELPPMRRERRRRVMALRPQERLAAVLGARQQLLATEELALRARADVDAGRMREAALQLRVAFEAALAELDGIISSERLTELRERRSAVGAAANAALVGELDDATVADVRGTLERVEAALRARAAGREPAASARDANQSSD